MLLVATSSTPLATAALLAWWLDDFTVEKQVVGEFINLLHDLLYTCNPPAAH